MILRDRYQHALGKSSQDALHPPKTTRAVVFSGVCHNVVVIGVLKLPNGVVAEFAFGSKLTRVPSVQCRTGIPCDSPSPARWSMAAIKTARQDGCNDASLSGPPTPQQRAWI